MTLSQTGINYICQNFGNASQCCVLTGLIWSTPSTGTSMGGTAQIVQRLVWGLETLTMIDPPRGDFTKADLDAANGAPVTFDDAKLITDHDEPTDLAGQWCYGAVLTGNITFTSTPSGAEVYLNDVDQGAVTPVTLTGLLTGSYTYKLTLSGYQDCTGAVTVVADTTVLVNCTMVPITPPPEGVSLLPLLMLGGAILAMIMLMRR